MGAVLCVFAQLYSYVLLFLQPHRPSSALSLYLIFLLLHAFLHLNDPMNNSSSTRLHLLFDASLQGYEKQTGLKLVNHPLVLELENCHTVDSIMEILQNKACTFTRFRDDGNKIMRSVKRVVHVLHALSTSATLGEGISLVCLMQRLCSQFLMLVL